MLFLLPLLSLCSAATITSTITTPAATSTPLSFSSNTTFETSILTAHNFYRIEHNASALTWNSSLSLYAASYASHCAFKHSGGPSGENLAAGYSNATASVDAWGLERESYDWKKPGFSEATGHFTQVVWADSVSVGCGRASCQGEGGMLLLLLFLPSWFLGGDWLGDICANDGIGTPGWYVVCEYWPAGNVVGDNNQFFVENVRRQIKGHLSDTVESGVTSWGKRSSRVEAEIHWGF
ncbi:PR-1-like protein [Mollisia scopiformis]|uniref:PR-1-like protein n=1 Tax=Mollisia scopiformis TaxID=149040 RepID=A0A194XR37_MOLSC|nr:PR-1-like protein [Mollisia scopiformis]KUJ22616.1 PR-1-like protein [Mollisia scopiformis]